MESKNRKIGFDIIRTYEKIVENELISDKMTENRTVKIKLQELEFQIEEQEIFGLKNRNRIY